MLLKIGYVCKIPSTRNGVLGGTFLSLQSIYYYLLIHRSKTMPTNVKQVCTNPVYVRLTWFDCESLNTCEFIRGAIPCATFVRCCSSLSRTRIVFPLLPHWVPFLVPKLRSEIVWHRFFAVLAFIRHFRSYIAVRKLLL